MNPPGRSPQKSPLQTRFNLKAFLAGRNMKPESYPTFDASLEWPLQPEVSFANIINGTLSQEEFPIIPNRPGFHCLVTHLTYLPRGILAGDEAGAFLSNTADTTNPETRLIMCTINLAEFLARVMEFPVVGGLFVESAANGGTIQGMRHIYVPEGWTLNGFYTGDLANQLVWNAQFFFLPSSQPMTTLFNY